MRIVQSCWACNQPNLLEFNAGWYGPEYNIMSWALSCLQLRKYYDNVVLYADSVSAKMLVDELQLPYSNLYCELDSLRSYDPGLWALPKIYAYSKQHESFLHVDGDVFIWQSFEKDLLSADLIAQNVETDTSYNDYIWKRFDKTLDFFPKEIVEERRSNSKIITYNAGILGGNDIAFFKEYTCKAMEFVNKNTKCFDSFNVTYFNVFFEQYLFFCIAKRRGKTVNVLFPEIKGGEQYWQFGNFVEVPYGKKYLHLLGPHKKILTNCDHLANRLRMDYPDYFYRIVSLFKQNRLTLKKDYYIKFDNLTERELVKRHNELQDSFMSGNLSVMDAINCEHKFEYSDFRKGLVSEAIDRAVIEHAQLREDHNKYLADIEGFENNVFLILKDKFAKYSLDYLYARDITIPGSFEAIFGDKSLGYDIAIVTDSIYEIVESEYDWSMIEFGEYGQTILMEQLMLPPSKIYTAIIPECHGGGYSLVNVDELDLHILDIFKKSQTIRSALLAIEPLFDEADLQDSRDEFEELITGRIKWALNHKLLRISVI